MTTAGLEALIRDLVKNGDEYDKLELKSSYDFSEKKDRIRLVKCVAAIANTDSTYFENMGYIVLGAKRSHLIGGFDALEEDSTSADMHQWIGEYVDPIINFSVERFRDETKGWWGVIIIFPSSDTHVIKREYTELSIRKGDVYVRHGDSIALADKSDHDRLQRRKFQSSIEKLEIEIGTLRERVEEQKVLKPFLKLYFLGEKDNMHESVEVQPVFWEKTKEQLDEEASNEARINEIEKEVGGLKNIVLTTHNFKAKTIARHKLIEELHKRKELHYKYQQNDPLISRIIKLDFILSNEGDSLGKGIHFYLYFPKSLELSADRESLQKEDIRNPELDRLTDVLPSILAPSHEFSRDPLSPPTPDFVNPKYGGPEIIKKDDDLVAEYWIDKLLQHHSHSFSPVYFVSPEENMDIEVPYRIYAENAPGVVQASLQLKVRPKRIG